MVGGWDLGIGWVGERVGGLGYERVSEGMADNICRISFLLFAGLFLMIALSIYFSFLVARIIQN